MKKRINSDDCSPLHRFEIQIFKIQGHTSESAVRLSAVYFLKYRFKKGKYFNLIIILTRLRTKNLAF